ncbi:YolD-like family protein [Bacillus sp. IBL03825]|uniref:YolD-like family protein n=1 Tax=Bacillus sp. IBL03825 TaxID=2953580 RepID=UPI00215844A0|nr:YolD-like family protein [Bacillus sp. IBL03825]MCR6850522.1 YolD-like family protein [Bacillus sp. IBL03825]MCR6850538.1 YolD-like family protein [Bacillus sp. IBL03825]
MKETRIPRGRGIEKWAPFSSMPEQFAGLHKLIHDQTKVSKPILDLQKSEEINQVLIQAIQTKEEVDLWHYKDGIILYKIVSIHKLDAINKTLVVTDAFGFNNSLYLVDIVECSIHK